MIWVACTIKNNIALSLSPEKRQWQALEEQNKKSRKTSEMTNALQEKINVQCLSKSPPTLQPVFVPHPKRPAAPCVACMAAGDRRPFALSRLSFRRSSGAFCSCRHS